MIVLVVDGAEHEIIPTEGQALGGLKARIGQMMKRGEHETFTLADGGEVQINFATAGVVEVIER